MKTSLIAIVIALLCFTTGGNAVASNPFDNPMEKVESMPYNKRLLEAKSSYPFSRWRKSFRHGLKQYTKENCEETQKVFDDLIENLIALGENEPKGEKVKLFKIAVLSVNELNDKISGLIETGEIEELCELIDRITVAAGLNPKEFAGGEGIANEWREW